MLEVGIVGGGLSGLLAAEALGARGCPPAWLLDSDDPLRASSAPGALVHAFPGRSFQVHPLLPRAARESARVVRRWMGDEPGLVSELPIVRPLEGRSGRRLQDSFQRDWTGREEDWTSFEWLSPEAFEARHPGVCGSGAVVCRPSFALELGRLIVRRLERAEASGVSLVQGRGASLSREGSGWRLELHDGRILSASCIVLCLGAGLASWFPGAGLELLGGELVRLRLGSPLDAVFSINGLHAVPLASGESVFGASRWLAGSAPPREQAFQELAGRYPGLFPGRPLPALAGGWRGIRCVHPRGKLPVAGSLPGAPGLHLCGGLGGKGLLWGPLAAAALSDELLDGIPVPEAIGAGRIPGGWSSPFVSP